MFLCWFTAVIVPVGLGKRFHAHVPQCRDTAMRFFHILSAAFIFSIMKKLEAATSDTDDTPVADELETVEDDVI